MIRLRAADSSSLGPQRFSTESSEYSRQYAPHTLSQYGWNRALSSHTAATPGPPSDELTASCKS